MENAKPKGVYIFGVMLILVSVVQLAWLANYPYYVYIFRQLPAPLIPLRFLVSNALRIIGLICGIGLLRFKARYRKMTLTLFWFVLITVYWKHPYSAFENHLRHVENISAASGMNTMFDLKLFAAVCTVVAISLDIIFASGFIYYFSRPKIKAYFK
ncbi:MAG: hypothetical protein PHO03_00095 [Candidatus Omnitrophica bacterium]|nr:hypothetical protein [Candidatus Omnitrophota bacterium]